MQALRGRSQANLVQSQKGYAARKDYLDKFNQFLYRLKATRAAATNSS
jgi:hypothetical protein